MHTATNEAWRLSIIAGTVLVTLLMASSVFAQGEISMRRLTSPPADINDGATDTVIDVERGVYTMFVYRITNDGSTALTLGSTVALTNLVNCSVYMQGQHATSVPAGPFGNTTDLSPVVYSTTDGPFSFTMSITSSDTNESPFDVTVTGNIVAPTGGGSVTPTLSGGGGGGGGCAAADSRTHLLLLALLLLTLSAGAARLCRG